MVLGIKIQSQCHNMIMRIVFIIKIVLKGSQFHWGSAGHVQGEGFRPDGETVFSLGEKVERYFCASGSFG